MKENKAFYKTQAWQKCRNAYMEYRNGLCEVCLSKGIYKPAEIVHHKIHLTPENIKDPSVSLCWDNLQAVCRDCHAEIHGGRRYKVDAQGHVYTRE